MPWVTGSFMTIHTYTVAKHNQKQFSYRSCSPFTAHDFLHFFCSNIDKIWYKISCSSPASSAEPAGHYVEFQIVSVLTNFEIESLYKWVLVSKPTTCLHDLQSAKLCKNLWPVLGPWFINIFNLLLTSGIVPTSFKTAVVKPLKNTPWSRDPGSKSNLFETFQSAIRVCQST